MKIENKIIIIKYVKKCYTTICNFYYIFPDFRISKMIPSINSISRILAGLIYYSHRGKIHQNNVLLTICVTIHWSCLLWILCDLLSSSIVNWFLICLKRLWLLSSNSLFSRVTLPIWSIACGGWSLSADVLSFYFFSALIESTMLFGEG